MMRKGCRNWVLLAAMLCCLDAPVAFAGPQQDTDAAETAYRKGDLIAAMALWRKTAEAGYAPAQARLADMLVVAEEQQEAVAWYRKAAEQGNVAGEYGLGIMYLKGEGVSKDVEKARSHILRSANQNYVPAMDSMRGFYELGEAGLPVDPAEARKWDDKIFAITGQRKPVPKPTPNAEKKK